MESLVGFNEIGEEEGGHGRGFLYPYHQRPIVTQPNAKYRDVCMFNAQATNLISLFTLSGSDGMSGPAFLPTHPMSHIYIVRSFRHLELQSSKLHVDHDGCYRPSPRRSCCCCCCCCPMVCGHQLSKGGRGPPSIAIWRTRRRRRSRRRRRRRSSYSSPSNLSHPSHLRSRVYCEIPYASLPTASSGHWAVICTLLYVRFPDVRLQMQDLVR